MPRMQNSWKWNVLLGLSLAPLIWFVLEPRTLVHEDLTQIFQVVPEVQQSVTALPARPGLSPTTAQSATALPVRPTLSTTSAQTSTALHVSPTLSPTAAPTLAGLRGKMPLSGRNCSSISEGNLCMKGVRWAPSWWMASRPGHPFICDIFEHFYCAMRGCRQWSYYQLHYVIDSLIKHNSTYRIAVDALLDLSADEHQPGPHLFHIDYNSSTYMYKRPKMNGTQYMRYIDDFISKAAKPGAQNKLTALPMPRTLYFMWLQGKDHLRTKNKYNHVAFEAWKKLNPRWNFTLITSDNIAELAPLSHALWKGDHNTNGKRLSHLSDLTRFELLCKNGGVWADASVMPMVPLNNFLPQELEKSGRDFLMYRFTHPHP